MASLVPQSIAGPVEIGENLSGYNPTIATYFAGTSFAVGVQFKNG